MNKKTETHLAQLVAAKGSLIEIKPDLAASVGSSDQGGE